MSSFEAICDPVLEAPEDPGAGTLIALGSGGWIVLEELDEREASGRSREGRAEPGHVEPNHRRILPRRRQTREGTGYFAFN